MPPGVEHKPFLKVLTSGSNDYTAVFQAQEYIMIGNSPVKIKAFQTKTLKPLEKVLCPMNAETPLLESKVDQHIMQDRRP